MTKRVKRKPLNEQSVSAKNKTIEKTVPVAKKGISSKVKLCIVLGILSFSIYSNTLRNGYAVDDNLFITRNSVVNMGVMGITQLLASPRMKGVETGNNDTYRPTSFIMFAVEKELFGFNPTTGHLINIILFSACVVLLFLFLDRLLEHKKTVIAFIAALLFAVHPIHTEVVANIKSRDELLCFFFAFWSLNSFITYFANGKNIRLVVGFVALFLSFLSKETSVSFIAIVPLVFFFYRTGNKRRSITITAAAVIGFAIFLGIRTIVLHGIAPGHSALAASADNQLLNVPAGASRLATAILTCGYYIKLLFIPHPLLCSYSYSTIPFVNFGNIWVLLSLTAYLSLIVFAFYRLIKFKKDLWAFGVLFYLITIALFSNIVFLPPALFAERFVFFASVGFCLLIALLIEKWLFSFSKSENAANTLSDLSRSKVLLFLVPIVIVFGSMTVSRNYDWKDDYSLYSTDVENAPQNSRMNIALGLVLDNNLENKELRPDVKSQMIEKGIGYLRSAIGITPANADAHAGLAHFYVVKKMYDSAEVHAKMAIMLNTMNVIATENLGLTYCNTKRFAEAIPLFKKAMQLNPKLDAEYRNIGICYLGMHQYDSAAINLKKALAATPENPKILYGQIAIAYNGMGQIDSAKKYEQLTRQYDPAFRLR